MQLLYILLFGHNILLKTIVGESIHVGTMCKLSSTADSAPIERESAIRKRNRFDNRQRYVS